MSVEVVHNNPDKQLQANVDSNEDKDVQKDGHVLQLEDNNVERATNDFKKSL